MALTLKLDDIKPLLGAVGLGQDPTPAPKPVNAIPPPPLQMPPTPAAAGFSEWAGDPQNAKKVTDGITQPGTPLLPPPPAPPLGANMPPPPQMASANPPPGKDMSFLAPPSPSMPGPPPAMGASTPNFSQQTKMNADIANNPDAYQKPMLKHAGFVGNLLNFGTAGLLGAAGGLHGDPGAGADWIAQQAAIDRGIPAANAAQYDLRNVKPLKDAAQLADINSQTAQRNADADKKSQQADDMTPFTLSPAQAQAINQPALAGTTATMRDYNRLLGMAGNNNTSSANNKNTNDAKVKIAATKAEVAALKPKQRDDQYIAIMSKPAAERTPDELAFKSGYEQYIKTSKTDPGVSRAVAGAMARPLQTVDPNTNNVIYQTAGNAIKSGAAAPASMDYAAEKGLQKDFTSGAASKNLNAFNTASAHLATLGQAAEALHNNDIQGLNRFGNEYNKQTGSPAPTNFQAVKSAVAGEVSKTFKGGQATDAEIKEFNDAVSSANSPAQLRGVISTYQDLMDSKREALQQQYTQGMQGKPNFGTPAVNGKKGITPPPTGGAPTEGQTKVNSHGDKVKFSGGKWGPA